MDPPCSVLEEPLEGEMSSGQQTSLRARVQTHQISAQKFLKREVKY